MSISRPALSRLRLMVALDRRRQELKAAVEHVATAEAEIAQLSDRLVEKQEFDQAVLDAIGRIVERGARAGLRTSLCGQAASNDTQLVEHLVRLGISSVSVDPSVAALTRRTVASAERRILLDAARGNGPGGDPARRP